MKSRLLILILSFLSLYSNGQPSLAFTEAVIIKKNGDSLKCFVEMIGGFEDVIKYKLNPDDRELILRTKEVSTIITFFRIYENVPIGKKEKVLPLAVDGPIKFYKGSYLNWGNPSSGGVTFFGKSFIEYIIKKDGSYIEVKENNFKEKLTEILKDCEKVTKKINDDSYKFDELEKAVEDYYNCNQPETSEEKYDSLLLGSWMLI